MRVEESHIADFDDLSNGFHLVKSQLVNSAGLKYYEFRKTLTPRYWLVWVHLLAGHAVLLATVVTLFNMRSADLGIQLLGVVLASLVLGYSFSYVSLFLHAASHYNLSSSKKLNDLLADALIGTLFGYPMSRYRPTHFAHHKLLGLPEDPEGGYVEALNVRFFGESLTGVRFLRLLRRHFQLAKVGRPAENARPTVPWVRFCGAALHAGLVVAAVWTGAFALAGAWIIGFVIISPLVTAVRLVLEHRKESADAKTNYTQVPHGAVSRIFGDGLVAQTMGGAGFNRHLLHHWDPQIPYTRLKDLETYLRDTEVGSIVAARTTSYMRAFRRLFRASIA